MKLNNIKIYAWLMMVMTFVVTSCRDDTFSEYWDDNSDTYTVTLNVGLEGMDYNTRSEGDDIRSISDGSKIDMLVYAVYYDANKENGDVSDNPDWQAATEYAKGIVDPDNKLTELNVDPGHGQTILYVGETLGHGTGVKQPITLTLKKGQDYKVVFWAQNQATEAFVIDDLKRVQMKYKVLHANDEENDGTAEETVKSVNNDEARDAFCRSVNLDGNQSNRSITIYLRRPLAQINVGTRGFDFEAITRNAPEGGKYLYSKIRINRAARYLNVVEDKVYTSTSKDGEEAYDPDNKDPEAFYTIDYEYDLIPAYWQMERPEYPSYTKYDLEDDKGIYNENGAYSAFLETHPDFFKNVTQKEGETSDDAKKRFFRETYKKEEFLKVHLYKHTDDEIAQYGKDGKDDFYLPYSGMGASMDIDEEALDRCEVFKYLSMCYVLTNSSDDYQDVLTNVKVWVAKDKEGTDEVEIANLTQVPVQRNRRTNIVGSLLTAEAKMEIVVDQDFAGRKIYGDESIQSGEIVEGFYYDAKNDEFQISSVNGLLFFQQLVNGDLLVRHESEKDKIGSSYLNQAYPYYPPNNDNITYQLSYKSHQRGRNDLSDDKVANLIYYGSKYKDLADHQEQEIKNYQGTKWKIKVTENNNWPEHNNFPFYNAKVKLMADIDLSGIDWIPIGFDCACWDSSLGGWNKNGNLEAYPEKKSFHYISLLTKTDEIDLTNRRVFCGTFDGNGHTIYNLKTKSFGAKVHDSALQNLKNDPYKGPYDNVQWFAYGFFGVVGPGAVIKNLTLQNVYIKGYNSVGGIVGQVSSVGFPAKIQNCVIDGGIIDAVPLYRGDLNTTEPSKNYWGRTMARGCYIGGIVGQFVAKDNEDDRAEITDCQVRNIVLQGYRRVGGIVGGIADQGSSTMSNNNIQLDIKIERNAIRNSVVLVNQYRAFDSFFDIMNKDGKVWQNGFGWGSGTTYTPMAGNIIGGYYHTKEEEAVAGDGWDAFGYTNGEGYYNKTNTGKDAYYNYVIEGGSGNNLASNVQYTELSVSPDKENKSNPEEDRLASYRKSTIKNVPMKYIPIFTSLFTDYVYLENNYYGETNLRTKLIFNPEVQVWCSTVTPNTFKLPVNFPNGYDIEKEDLSDLCGNTGMYVETVTLDGSASPGGRSVITPNNVDGKNSCAMYVTARDREQFNVNKTLTSLAGKTDDKKYSKSTNISNIVLRGSPYAWAGMLISPNRNMSALNLTNVIIYDVYQTLALEKDIKEAKEEQVSNAEIQNYTDWTEASVTLNATNCNFRGYTKPGAGWENINYIGTTFEQGSETKYSYDTMGDDEHRNEYKTIDVEAATDFSGCYFKAPYYINLRPLRKLNENPDTNLTVSFSDCYATSVYDNVIIFDVKDVEDYYKTKYGTDKEVYYIRIEKDTEAGHTIVSYLGEGGENDVMYEQVGKTNKTKPE